MNVEEFLMVCGIVTIAICTTIGRAVASFILGCGLYQLVIVTIGSIVGKEFFAIL